MIHEKKAEVDLEKCNEACDIMLGLLSRDDNPGIKIEYYHELQKLIREYDKLVRKCYGQEETINSLKRREEKRYGCYGWRK